MKARKITVVVEIAVLLTLIAGAVSQAAEAGKIPLDAFLAQVRANALSVKASREASLGASERAKEAELLFAPQLFAESQFLSDKKQQISPATMGTEQRGSLYRLGIQQQTRYGLKAKLQTEVGSVNVIGASPGLLQNPAFDEGRQTLELSQSLLRNGFGSEVRAIEQLLSSQAQAKSLTEAFRAKVTLVQAEAAYWRLAAARDLVRVKAESLERATKIRDWNKRRADLELGRKSDVLQAEAAVKLAGLDLQAAKDEERSASWAFNTARNVDGDTVAEALDPLDIAAVEKLSPPKREGEREDVRAAEQAKVAAEAQAIAGTEKNRPSLDLLGQITLNGKDQEVGQAYRNSFSTDHPTVGAGVKLVIPLGAVSTVDEGYRKEAHAADLGYQSRKFEVDREWKDLEKRYDEAKRRLALSIEIEEAQREKYVAEKKRHEVGQSTTYTVLQFEQDLAAAQLTRIRLHADVLVTLAQMKLFQDSKI